MSSKNLSVRTHVQSRSENAISTPISAYARRNASSPSPTSPEFLREERDWPSPIVSPMPFSMPSLPPTLFPGFGDYSFPPTPDFEFPAKRRQRPSVSGTSSESSKNASPQYQCKPLPDLGEVQYIRRTSIGGIRISSTPQVADVGESYLQRRRHVGLDCPMVQEDTS